VRPGVGVDGGVDVVVVAEQLRRSVPGGVGTYVAGLLSGLGALSSPERSGITVVASRVAAPDPLERFGFPVTTSPIPGRLIAKAWDLGIGRVRTSGLVHATSFALPPTSANLIVTVHDLAFLSHPEAYPVRGLRWHRAALHRAIDRAVAFVVPAEVVAAQLAEAGADSSLIHVIEEGADHLPAPDEAAATDLLDSHGVRSGFLLAVGTMEPRKNLRRLFASYVAVRAQLPAPWPLLVAGPSGWGDALGNAPEGVVLLGSVPAPTLAALYARALVVCYVPIEEGFGLPVVEAMRAGTPVLSSLVPSAKGASILVDPFDEASITEGLLLAATDSTVREEAIEAGHRRTADLTWKRTAEAHVNLWRSVLARVSR
jgi:glycosyltransferase involved in cell wall biosynthesis